MTIQEAIKSGRPFKRPHYENWLVIDELNNKIWFSINKGKGGFFPSFSAEDLLANDWIVQEKWYENFKKKYPNGVLCWVYIEGMCTNEMRVVIDYDKEKEVFKTITSSEDGLIFEEHRSVKPVKPEEAPAILDLEG